MLKVVLNSQRETYNIKTAENSIDFNFDEFFLFVFAFKVFYHWKYCWHNVFHFFSGDWATLVFVIQLECPWMYRYSLSLERLKWLGFLCIHMNFKFEIPSLEPRTVIFEKIRIKNSHLSFSSREPRQVIEIASRYSSKLTIPSLSLFKKSKRYSANCVWSPCGKS